MATLSSVLAWRIPGTEEPGGLQSMGCKESDSTEQLTLLSPSPSLLFLPHNRSINPRERCGGKEHDFIWWLTEMSDYYLRVSI